MIVVAMDGPAGAGKSTVARRLSETLGYTLLDTGALYRTVALACHRMGLTKLDEDAVTRVAEDVVRRGALVIEKTPSGMDVRLEGELVGEAIRSPEMSMGASTVSAIPGVRAALLDVQRSFAAKGLGVVCEGRDIGTVVFPDAAAKIFLTASIDARAARRHSELVAKRGAAAPSLEETRQEVAQRDEQDKNRAIAPLKQADDAVLVDSTGMALDAVVARCLELVRARVGPG